MSSSHLHVVVVVPVVLVVVVLVVVADERVRLGPTPKIGVGLRLVRGCTLYVWSGFASPFACTCMFVHLALCISTHFGRLSLYLLDVI